jgi:hypothetical protein
MLSKYKHPLATMLVIAAFGGGLAPCFAQDAGTKDPDRWFKEDATAQARYQTSTKEAHAGYREALKECQPMKGSERAACLKEAKANLQADLAAAKEQRGH